MALQDLVASRASKPINLFIADEIDDALDVSGLERLMGILEEKGRERGTLVLISHNDIGDWVRNVSKVTKSGYYSEISGYLSAG
jgi:DNA repair exonuclease SbcCD ATPase subunit